MTTPTKPLLTTNEVRDQFIAFFAERAGHTVVPSSPVVPHDDPTLLFTNAGMNQFKPLFLETVQTSSPLFGLKRAVDSQKCIRARGKHNDLDDVGKDTYHHTFFEMLGNWSFGDYFKQEAIDWAFELLTVHWGLDPSRLYATYFEGNKDLGVDTDREAYNLWSKHLPAQRIIPGNMKDNFWEMGNTGPCGPCSELHYDGRSDEERAQTPGDTLVNKDHPDVIEIWNLVFIQYDRQESGLKPLPNKHVDTGMGLERIARVIQGKASNYDTDAFTPIFAAIQAATGARPYNGGGGADTLSDPIDTAYRVVADHIRTLSFAIADGATPSNDGRGYVLRAILRRAVRFGRQNLGAPEGFFSTLVPALANQMGAFYPELIKHQQHIIEVLKDEEVAFGKTLEVGSGYFDQAVAGLFAHHPLAGPNALELDGEHQLRGMRDDDGWGVGLMKKQADSTTWRTVEVFRVAHINAQWIADWIGSPVTLPAQDAFKLHDTYGFPIELTKAMADERGITVDTEGFTKLMEEAKERSRAATTDDALAKLFLPPDALARLKALNIKPTRDNDKFTPRMMTATVKAIWNGTDFDENTQASTASAEDRVAIILDKTCFYAEMGGQQGDTGRLVVTREANPGIGSSKGGEFEVLATHPCGDYVLHMGRMRKGELRVGDTIETRLEKHRRAAIESNHTATHLANWALRAVLGDHIDQKGSLVAPDRLRFDFSHTGALTEQELTDIEAKVNAQINEARTVHTSLAPLAQAKKISSLRAVFGETYPDPVRVVSIGPAVEDLLANPENPDWANASIEFCGGAHLTTTDNAGAFTITAEESVSKGVRRIVALTGEPARAAIVLSESLTKQVARAEALPDDQLAPALPQLTAAIDNAESSLATKIALRVRLAALSKRAKAASKQADAASRGSAVEEARAIADAATSDTIIATLSTDDRAALLSAMDAIRAKHPDAAIMLIGVGDEKVAAVAKVAKPMIDKGLKAGDWVRATSEALGGKGGGKPDSAQGGGNDPSLAQAGLEAAKAHATTATASPTT